MAKSQLSRPKWKNLPFSRVHRGKPTTIAQKTVSLQPAKFHAIPTLRHMISTSSFLPWTLILHVRESLGRPWWSVLHQFKRTYSSSLSPQKTSKHTKQVSSFVRISSTLIQAHAFSMNHSFAGGWLSICSSYTLKVWLIVILVL